MMNNNLFHLFYFILFYNFYVKGVALNKKIIFFKFFNKSMIKNKNKKLVESLNFKLYQCKFYYTIHVLVTCTQRINYCGNSAYNFLCSNVWGGGYYHYNC